MHFARYRECLRNVTPARESRYDFVPKHDFLRCKEVLTSKVDAVSLLVKERTGISQTSV